MGNLEDKLAAAQALKANEDTKKQQQRSKKSTKMNNSHIDTSVMSMDDMVFGTPSSNDFVDGYNNGDQHHKYDANKEMEAIKSGEFTYNNQNSKLPKAILESIMANPLNMEPVEDETTQIIDEATQNRTMDIINKLEKRERDAKKTVTQHKETVMAESVGTTRNNLEVLIDNKLEEFKKTILSELRNINEPQMCLMKIGDKFTFMDSDGSVYECSMRYIGKGKMRNK